MTSNANNSGDSRGVIRRRGPYKNYLKPNSSDIDIPRSTRSDKRIRTETADQVTLESLGSGGNHVFEAHEENEAENDLPTSDDVQLNMHSDEASIVSETEVEPDEDMYCFFEVQEQASIVHETVDLEEDTYSMFERCVPYTSSRMDGIVDGDDNPRYNEEINDYVGDTIDDPYLSQPLCPCTPTNVGEAIMTVMTLGIRHSFTWIGIIDTLKTVNVLFAKDVVPATKYKLFKYFATETDYFRYNIICPRCETLLARQSKISDREIRICECGNEVKVSEMESFFLTVSFDKQLKNMLSRPDVKRNLNYRHTRPQNLDGDLRDIYDGKIYQKLSTEGEPLSCQYNLSYTFNTDGCQAGNSSTTTLWPIYATINELPPDMRNKNMILVGIWACQRKPNMASFLKPFVDDATELSNNGITFEIDNGVVTSKIYALCSCVDSVARSAMLNMKQFNGYYGCTLCEHPGDSVVDKGGRRLIKYTVSTDVPAERTHQSIVRDMKLAHEVTMTTRKRLDVKGVFGPSPLMNLEHFDLSQGLPPDSMHLFSGFMKQYTGKVLGDNGKEYYVGAPQVIKVINERLTALRPPKCITRTPRSLKDRALWKASEWRSWLIFYAFVCLQGILPDKYVTHLAMLVTAVRILMEDSIPKDRLLYAHDLILKFVILFQSYFGESAMNYNVHLLLHVCRGVENFGPLWTHNTYPYENENRYLLQLKKSPTHLALQISRRFVMYKSISAFGDKYTISHRIKDFCEQLSESRVQFSYKSGDCTLIGSGKPYSLNPEEKACLRGYDFDECLSYEKMICKHYKYNSTRYERSKKNNNTTVITKGGNFVIITNICKISKAISDIPKVVVFCRQIVIAETPFLQTDDVCVTHIKKCRSLSRGPLGAYTSESLSR